MNANFERTKRINGWETGLELPDLKIGDCILFEDESDDQQGHVVVDIIRPNGAHICVQHDPEWTPVRNSSMFVYGKKKFRKKIIYNE